MSAQRPSTTVGTFGSPKPTEALSGKKEQTSYSLRSWLLVVLKIWRLDVHLTMAVSVSPRYSRPPSAVQQFCLAILVLGCLSVPNQVLPFLLCEDKFCIVAVVIYHFTVPRVHFPLSFYVTTVFFLLHGGGDAGRVTSVPCSLPNSNNLECDIEDWPTERTVSGQASTS